MKKESPYRSFASYYDRVMDHTDYQGWYSHVMRLVRKFGINTDKVIDLGGGTGELARYFRKGGIAMDVLDISPDMIKEAKKKKYHTQPRFYCQDIREIKTRTRYDLAICLNNTANYLLQKSDLKKTFASIASILKPGGHVIMDLCSAYYYKKEYDGEIFCRNFKDFTYIWAHNYNKKTNCAEMHIEIHDFKSAKTIREFHLNRLHLDNDIIKAAARYFENLAVLSGFTFKKRHAKSREIYLVFRLK